jgi:hypothetical protein
VYNLGQNLQSRVGWVKRGFCSPTNGEKTTITLKIQLCSTSRCFSSPPPNIQVVLAPRRPVFKSNFRLHESSPDLFPSCASLPSLPPNRSLLKSIAPCQIFRSQWSSLLPLVRTKTPSTLPTYRSNKHSGSYPPKLAAPWVSLELIFRGLLQTSIASTSTLRPQTMCRGP